MIYLRDFQFLKGAIREFSERREVRDGIVRLWRLEAEG